ncbi:hypothetical protein GH714_027449 [Hevea brasiliensis]|uniref:Wall-associated receptor kinase galacturonan-binding domain-containing protein n=1 Tax=Hevea brasiliensis TaxID=3981 RepID=A0A6A6LJG6_HEVBR|nr:hypothetical protein GH714_027449 [Hevea brasiliensis]
MSVKLVYGVSFSLALLLAIQLAIAKEPIAKPNCTDHCGNINIPYPFGMSKGCYLDEWFEIECSKSVHGPPRAFLSKIKMELLNVSVGGQAIVRSPIISFNCSGSKTDPPVNLTGSPFSISPRNIFTAIGCNTSALMTDNPLQRLGDGYEGNPYLRCTDVDECKDPEYGGHCKGITRCVNTSGSFKCVPDAKWIILLCVGGIIGVLVIVFGIRRLCNLMKKRRNIQLKRKFFKRNGGLLLQQQLTSSDGSVKKTQILTSKELEKATDRFNDNRILGQGGQGTVYKGMLADGRSCCQNVQIS